MNEWLNPAVVIPCIALVVSVLCPVVVAVINAFVEGKRYKKRFVVEHRHDAIERYLQAAGKCLFQIVPSESSKAFTEYSASCSEIFMYLPEELWEDVEALTKALVLLYDKESAQALEQARTLYFSLCRKVSKQRRSLSQKQRWKKSK